MGSFRVMSHEFGSQFIMMRQLTPLLLVLGVVVLVRCSGQGQKMHVPWPLLPSDAPTMLVNT